MCILHVSWHVGLFASILFVFGKFALLCVTTIFSIQCSPEKKEMLMCVLFLALQLMVAERQGLINIYDLVSCKPIASLTTLSASALVEADWSPLNNMLVGAVAGNHSFVWNMSVGR